MGGYFGQLYFGLYSGLVVGNYISASLVGIGSINASVGRVASIAADLVGVGSITAALLNISDGDSDSPEVLRSTINADTEVLTREV